MKCSFFPTQTNRSFLFILLLSLLFPVAGQSDPTDMNHSLDVSWELLHNFSARSENACALFTLKNNGSVAMNEHNWVMYFNMAPRRLVPPAAGQQAGIRHINGDLYVLEPTADFYLPPGESRNIRYEFEGCMIKQSDAPAGLYLVWMDQEQNEEQILPVGSYTIRPFVRREQTACSPSDTQQYPVHEERYLYYKELDAYFDGSLPLIIPTPRDHARKDEWIRLDSSWVLSLDPGLEAESRYLQEKLWEMAGIRIKAAAGKRAGAPRIILKLQEAPEKEAYQLSIRGNTIRIEGGRAGVFYGIQSLLQLIPYESLKARSGMTDLPELRITDAPRFGYRGLHIDVCRNFQSKEQILKIIDLMARYKLNRLHLLLSEDEAWRLEIRGLPELTETGSKRGHANDESQCLPPAYGSGPFPDSPQNHGTGSYTREDYKEIIRYAHDWHIEVVPSMNFPGHARAAIKAMEARYQKYMDENKPDQANEFRLIDPEDASVYRSAQFYNDNVVCVGLESVYHFYETVIDDVLSMHREAGVPLRMIHTGGDEVPVGAWTRSPVCDRLLTQLTDIRDPKHLQHYFLRRILTILSERGLRAGGWEEVVLTKDDHWQHQVSDLYVKDGIIPYIWNNLEGSEDLGYRIANAGYDVVLCPVTNFYFDLAYDADPEEPGLYWGGFNSERDAWEFLPFSMITDYDEMHPGKQFDPSASSTDLEALRPESRQHILGLQAQLWHETIRGSEMMEYYLLPKLIAFADRCWAAAPAWEMPASDSGGVIRDRERASFSQKLYREELPKLSLINSGYTYRVPPPGFRILEGNLEVIAIDPEMNIRYTFDGTEPDRSSPVYSTPLPFNPAIRLKCFDRAGRSSRSVGVNGE